MYDLILKWLKKGNSILIYVLMGECIIAFVLFIHNQIKVNGIF